MEDQVFELLDMYSAPRPVAQVGQVVYTAKECDRLLEWARGRQASYPFEDNSQTFERLARRHVRGLRPWEVRRAMEAWGLGNRRAA